MQIKQNLFDFLCLIPDGKVMTYGYLSKLFATNPVTIGRVLSQNNNQDKYPCYKIVNSDGSLGGYNLGIQEKIKRLENNGIKVVDERVTEDYFWFPTTSHYFLAIPLEFKEQREFGNIVFDIKRTFPDMDIRIQKSKSSHITIRFFGDIEITQFHDYVQNTLKMMHKLKPLGDTKLTFDKLGNFDERVYFWETSSQQEKDALQNIYDIFHESLSIEKEDRPYSSHLTLFKKMNPEKDVSEILEYIQNKHLQINLTKITYYCAIDRFFQTPLVDILI